MAKETQKLRVRGMSCRHCVQAITAAVSALKGVSSVDVNLEKGLATVEFDTSATTLAAITTAIEEQGYAVI